MIVSSAKKNIGLRSALGAGFILLFTLFVAVLIRWTDNFFADDSYFYLQVAWNIARGMGSTFNNVVPTNGYHPLWMLVCVAVFKIVHAKAAAVHAIGLVISILNGVSALLFARLLRRWAPGMWWLAFAVYIPFAFVTQLGTEGALSGCVLSAMLLAASGLLEKPDARASWAFALSGALAVLSRLDSIFVVGLVSIAVYITVLRESESARRPALAAAWVSYPVLWGSYIASNMAWFGTVQPISGMLKSHPSAGRLFLSNLPHVALVALLLISLSLLVIGMLRRDRFFYSVELPFAAGVFLHASYIAFVMSNETRWKCYYTSWWILAAIVTARAGALLLERQPAFVSKVAALLALVFLGSVLYMVSYRKLAYYQPDSVGVGYEENLVNRARLHTVLAFDGPGRLAYYTDLQVIALDGLMGDLQFQKDLNEKGIAAFGVLHHVDGFVGPSEPLHLDGKKAYCDAVYTSSTQLHCVQSGPGNWSADAVTVYSRLTGAPAGTIPLRESNMVWNAKMAAWRIEPAESSRY